MVGGTRCLLVHQDGVVGGWACAAAHGADHAVPWLLRPGDGRMSVVRDPACHAAAGDPPTRTRCPRGAWQDRRRVETVRARLPVGCHCKKGRHRVWGYCQARLACTRAAFTVLVQWQGIQPTASGFVPLSMAALSL
jgi:hypothetical protein